MNEAVIAKAKELALALAMSPEYISMRAAEDAATQDEALTEAAGRYNDLQQEVERMSLAKQPDFEKMAELTDKMNAIQKEIQELPLAKAMQQARGAFADMMNRVNAELSKVLNPDSQGGCTGNCASCGGSGQSGGGCQSCSTCSNCGTSCATNSSLCPRCGCAMSGST